MPQNFKKEIAISLRKDGFSYSSISDQLHISKSTIASWLNKIKLSETETEKLKKRRQEILKIASQKKVSRTLHQIEQIKKYSSRDIKNISKRELWLMGIMLYWRERFLNKNDSDIKHGVRFTSSDPSLIKIFLKWLKEVGHIGDEEISFDIFINSDKREVIDSIVNNWGHITGFNKMYFNHIYYKNKILAKKGRKHQLINKRKIYSHLSENGYLRIRVKSSSMLARQITGWIEGIQLNLLDIK